MAQLLSSPLILLLVALTCLDISSTHGAPLTAGSLMTGAVSLKSSGCMLMGNVSLGSPAQNFTLLFDFSSPNLYVIGVNASYSGSSQSTVTDKNTYNSSASSSYTAANSNFSATDTYLSGSVGSDTLLMGDEGGLQATVSFEMASLVDYSTQSASFDGVFGLSSSTADASTTLLGQLQSSLNSPVFTLCLSPNGDSNIELGGLNTDYCDTSWVALNAPSAVIADMPLFNITSASFSGGGCDWVDSPMQVSIGLDSQGPMRVSYQMLEVFIQASAATYNQTTRRYELTAHQASNANDVDLHLESGDLFLVSRYDYINTDSDGTDYLYVDGYYDAHTTPDNILHLGSRFLFSHCLSKNFQTGVWSVALNGWAVW